MLDANPVAKHWRRDDDDDDADDDDGDDDDNAGDVFQAWFMMKVIPASASHCSYLSSLSLCCTQLESFTSLCTIISHECIDLGITVQLCWSLVCCCSHKV